MKIDDYIITPDVTVFQALEVINENAKGIVFVCDRRRLIGVVTDGDVRRYMLQKGNLEENIMKIANREATFCIDNKDNEKRALHMMKQKSISAIPILNCKNEIIKIYFSNGSVAQNNLPLKSVNVPLVIMAGGKGTRLKPFTDILPKPLIPIGDRTITEHIVNKLADYGCTEIYMIVNYKKDFIKAYFRDGCCKNNINFVDEMVPLGTGGGLKLLEGKIQKTFFMTNSDVLIDADYAAILKKHQKQNSLLTLVCAKKTFSIPYGTIDIDEDELVYRLTEKPSSAYLVNTGFYVIEPELLEIIPKNTFIHITEIIQICLQKKCKIGVYVIEDDDWADMGQFDEMEKMKEKLGLVEGVYR